MSEEPVQVEQLLIEIDPCPDQHPLLPSNPDYTSPTLPLLPAPPGVVIENPYSEVEFAPVLPTDLTSIPILGSTESDCSIVCLFVVLFHATRGHEIVWSQPDELNLEGVEFKAVPSGMHTIERDFIYFRKSGLYGLSCFAKRTLLSESEDSVERGARMMAVGVLSISPDFLPSHTNFLATSIQNLLDNPTDFSHLADYYTSHTFDSIREQRHPNLDITIINTSILSAVSGGHDFARFIQILGPSVFVLWKFLLLQSRVLFYSKPPIGPCCNWVYFTCLLAQCDVIKINPNPHFYISVADLDALKEEQSFVACCTEQILQIKKAYYDVFVPVLRSGSGEIDSAKITCPGVMLRPVLFINNTDINRYRSLMKRCDEYRGVLTDRDQLNQTCIQFFREVNNNLFSHFTDYSQFESLINPHLLRRAGLDAYGDFSFLRFFSQTYNLRLNLQRDSEVSTLLCCSPRVGGML